MHSKHHRRERQRIAAFRFVSRNGRRKQPAYKLGHWSPRRAWYWYVDLCIAVRRYSDQAQRQAKEITLGIICDGLHRTKLPCGNRAVTGNPVTVRIEPRTK